MGFWEERMYDDIVALLHYLEQVEFVRFLGATGVSGAIFAGIFFPLQWWTNVHYRPSLYIAFVPSLVAGFTLHKYWTFHQLGTDTVWIQLALYTLKRLVLIRLNEYVLVRLVERHGYSSTLGQLLIAVSGLVLNYAILKVIFSL